MTFSVSGLPPSGVAASFAPPSITATGSSTMTITPSAMTTPGTYPLTITATSGALVRTSPVTLVVRAAR